MTTNEKSSARHMLTLRIDLSSVALAKALRGRLMQSGYSPTLAEVYRMGLAAGLAKLAKKHGAKAAAA